MADALIVQSAPPVAFYASGPRPASVDLSWPRLAGIGEISSTLRIDGQGGENSAARVALDNGDGIVTDVLAALPLRSPAVIVRGDEILFSGLVVEIIIAPEAMIELEA